MEETLYTYSLLNIMTIICLERKTFIFSGVSMCQSVFDYTFLCFIEKKLPQDLSNHRFYHDPIGH